MGRRLRLRLEDAVAALEREDIGSALEVLVPIWRRRPTGRIGDLVERLGHRQLELEPWAETGEALLDRALVVARNAHPAGLSYVLDAVRREPRGAQPVLEALQRAMADPRFAREVLHWTADPPSPNAPFWKLAMALLQGPADEGCRRAFEALSRGAGTDVLPKTSQKAIRSLAQQALRRMKPEVPVSAKERAALEAMEGWMEGTSPRRTDLEPLRRAACRWPPDEGALHVWADALMEAGNVRGEFILLQLRHRQTPLVGPPKARMEALEKLYRVDWLAPLGPNLKLSGCRFEAGLPVRLAATGPLTRCPEAAVVQELEVDREGASLEHVQPAVVVGVQSWGALQAAAAGSPERVVIKTLPLPLQVVRGQVRQLEKVPLEALPALRGLEGVERVAVRVSDAGELLQAVTALRTWPGHVEARMPHASWRRRAGRERLSVGAVGLEAREPLVRLVERMPPDAELVLRPSLPSELRSSLNVTKET